MTPESYALLGLTAIIGALAGALMFAVLRFGAAARDTRQQLRGHSGETALLSAALQEAVVKLKAQERATAARAEASERLSGEIISSLTAGLLVVGLNSRSASSIRPADACCGVPEAASFDDYRQLLGEPALSAVIDECLDHVAIARRRCPCRRAGGRTRTSA